MLGSMLGDCLGEWFNSSVMVPQLSIATGIHMNGIESRMSAAWRVAGGFVLHHEHGHHECIGGDIKIIWLYRKDQVARTMSQLAAHVTGKWSYYKRNEKPKKTGSVDIATALRVIKDQKHAREHARKVIWGSHEYGRNVFEIAYEEVDARLDELCSFLGKQRSDIRTPDTHRSPTYRRIITNHVAIEKVVRGAL